MYTLLIIIHVIVSIILIAVILLQAGRGGGVSELFGGSSTQTIFGTSAQQFLMKMTAAAAILFIVTSLSLAMLSAKRSRSLMGPGDAMRLDMGSVADIPQEAGEEAPVDDAAGRAEAVTVKTPLVETPAVEKVAPAEDKGKPVGPQ